VLHFWPGVLATILGGAVVAAAGYWLLDRRLHLRDRADHAREIETAQKAVRDAVLKVARGELEFVVARVNTYRDALANDSVPFPSFDTNGWSLISQAHAFNDRGGFKREASAYNRVRSFNELLRNTPIWCRAVQRLYFT
jgi:hypothetical protein